MIDSFMNLCKYHFVSTVYMEHFLDRRSCLALFIFG
jgi:hypothetical protein